MRTLLLLSLLTLTACASDGPDHGQPLNRAADEQALLKLHEAGLKAHMDGDVDALLATQAEDFVLLNRGEISSPTKAELKRFLGPYLSSTKFEFYRDAVTPIVRVSTDGSLGWVIAQVEARGLSVTSQGEQRRVEFVVAWIELYEKREGRWLAIGNASSFKSG